MEPLSRYLISLENEAETQSLAESLAHSVCACILSIECSQGMQWHLVGDLGVGKTTFVRALLRACGYTGRIKSPTYTLCEPYTISSNAQQFNVYHFDLYRLNNPREWEEAGFRDYLNQAALNIIEWPERAHLPIPDVEMIMHYAHNLSRCFTIQAWTELGRKCLLPLAAFKNENETDRS